MPSQEISPERIKTSSQEARQPVGVDQLIQQHERMSETASLADDAARSFARDCNGSFGGTIPAPTAYTIIGNIKTLLWSLGEIVRFLPTGLANSGLNPAIVLTEDDAAIDPQQSIMQATLVLAQIHTHLEAAANLADIAQSSIGGQGYKPASGQGG